MLERPRQVGDDHFEITSGGRGALFIAFVVERWLQSAPQRPIEFGGP